ncbi:MAG: exopolysaccharide biosynthesis protein [bacterium]
MNVPILFSKRLEDWLNNKHIKTLADLLIISSEKSFAVCILVLMIIPALPLPTGGITHIFEIISILLGIEMILGRKVIWLPKRWLNIDLSGIGKNKIIISSLRKLKWIEKHSKKRLETILANDYFLRITGFLFLLFCFAAFIAPPFSGLDTLPSLAAVLIALSLIFEDVILYIIGLIIGLIGIGTIFVLGGAILNSFKLI